MVNLPTLVEMFKAGMHFGHKTSKWHPTMKPYIATTQHDIHIINLEQTQEKLQNTTLFVKSIVRSNGKILFIGTKPQAKEIIQKYASEVNMPYITSRWLGGTFTNFSVIKKLIKKYSTFKKQQEAGELEKYTKSEQLGFQKEIVRLENLLAGLVSLEKLPDAVFVVDLKKEKTAVHEANLLKIPVIAICDTNTKPALAQYPIPANDDSIKSIEIVTSLIAATIKEETELMKILAINVEQPVGVHAVSS